MLTFGKAKAVQCYAYLLAWLIFVSLGLYWYLNHGGFELSALSQTGFGYVEDKDYDTATHEEQNNLYVSSRQVSNKNYIKDDSHDETKNHGPQTYTVHKKWDNNKDALQEDTSFNYGYDMEDEDAGVDDKAPDRLCNPPEKIKAAEENVQVPDFKLDSIIVLLRHGDRGPLTHVGSRNVSHINCSTDNPEVHNLFKFSSDTLPKLPGYSQFIGPFHTFPKVPPSSQCNLGQLTQLGFSQLYVLGKMIRSTYKTTLFNQNYFSLNNNYNFATSSAMKDISESMPIKVISYSTRYRRTFQSLLAFLYGLVGPKYLTQSTSIRESQSITFCFNDCTCRAVDRLKKSAMLKYKPEQSDKQTMIKIVDHLNSILHEDNFKKTGTALLDSLLVFYCHNAKLPCKGEKRNNNNNNNTPTKKSWLKRLRNLSSSSHSETKTCVRSEEIARLIRYIEIENEGLKKLSQNRKYYLLSSYGLMREIVNLALKMISAASSSNPSQHYHGAQTGFQQQASSLLSSSIMGNNNYYPSAKSAFGKTRVAVFSGHDTTLQIITGALGIFENHSDIHLPPYGSRLIFEFYRKTNVPPNSPRKHYFRVIYNGVAVTNLISFCKHNLVKSGKLEGKETGSRHHGEKSSETLAKAQFCPMESLVRFLHDHYFEAFGNATNFRDACQFI